MPHFDPPELGRPAHPHTPEVRPSLTKEPGDVFAKSEFYNRLIQIVIVVAAAIAIIFALLP